MVLFVTGTNTGVGKTVFSYLLVKALLEKGVKVGYWKPVETGADPFPPDATLLSELLKVPLEEVVSATFRLPLAPAVAQKYEGKKLDLSFLKEEFERRKERYDFLVVEGAGGLAVPIFGDYTYADFARELKLPTLVVADARLGTINCSYLTAAFARQKGVEAVGFAFNNFTGVDPSEKDNPSVVAALTGLPVLFRIPRSRDWKRLKLEPIAVEKLLFLLGGKENPYRPTG
ncbi:MAG: dethiobiotin synthase [Aquificae bacterium]|nr:dethiobiotin synthase [Aquificota bacterium]